MTNKAKKDHPVKRASKKMTKEEQSKQFIAAAREIGVDETGREFEVALRKIVPPRRFK